MKRKRAVFAAAFVAHGADPWTMGEAAQRFRAGEVPFPASKEPALLFGIAFLSLIFTGPGRFAIDAVIWHRRPRGGFEPADPSSIKHPPENAPGGGV